MNLRSRGEKSRLAVIAALLFWCSALILYRLYRAHDVISSGLLWNLFLACVPLLWSAMFQTAMARKNRLASGTYFVLWLLFLPNAPYILTDLIHLAPLPNVPLWFVLAMLLSCAGTGTLLGYLSLITVHKVIGKRFGAMAAWGVVVYSLMLCGFGIYLGRFLRWNSWDAFMHPLQLSKTIFQQFMNPGEHPHPISVTIIYGCGLIIGYFALRAVASAMQEE